MPEHAIDSVRAKVIAIFTELAGDRARALDGERLPEHIGSVISLALSGPGATELGRASADDIAFHLTDWNADAAFLVALHLFPERFTPEEIQAGVDSFLDLAPMNVIAAARLSGNSTEDAFGQCGRLMGSSVANWSGMGSGLSD